MISYRKKYKNETVTVDRLTIREVVRKILSINPEYSFETVENTLRYLVNQEQMDLTMHRYITDELKEIYKEIKEKHTHNECCECSLM